MAESFIKLHRKMLQWEWYGNPNTVSLFIHCLLKANWKPGTWRGVHYEAGQFITSLSTLSKETGLTVSQVRSSLNALKMTGELTSKSQGKCRVITVNNWNLYQGYDKVNDKQTAGKIATDKEIKEVKNKKIHCFSERNVDYDALEKEVNDG